MRQEFRLPDVDSSGLRLAVLVLSFALSTGAGPAQQQEAPVSPPETSPIAPGAAATPGAAIPTYPDSMKGLENLVKDMLKLEKEGNQQQLALYEKSLALPDPDRWFKSVFGEELGADMTRVSAPMRADAEIHTADMLATQIAEKRTDIEVVRFDNACNSKATAFEYPFLLLRQKPEHLYDVRLKGKSGGALWAYFAYVDGGFRFIGNMTRKEIRAHENMRSGGSTPKMQAGGTVSAAKLVYRVQPEYPTDLKQQGIQGTVTLHAIIATDGSVRDLSVDEGICPLSQLSLDAVKQWRYAPTLLNGQPVEVDTTITVAFSLHPPP